MESPSCKVHAAKQKNNHSKRQQNNKCNSWLCFFWTCQHARPPTERKLSWRAIFCQSSDRTLWPWFKREKNSQTQGSPSWKLQNYSFSPSTTCRCQLDSKFLLWCNAKEVAPTCSASWVWACCTSLPGRSASWRTALEPNDINGGCFVVLFKAWGGRLLEEGRKGSKQLK